MPALTHRDANASNMLDMLDLSSPAFRDAAQAGSGRWFIRGALACSG